MSKTFYVYAHFINETDERPFYVGKGTGGRAYSKANRTSAWKEKVKNGYAVKILKDNLLEKEAYDLEANLIEQYGRIDIGTGCLVNVIKGNECLMTAKPVPVELENFIKKWIFKKALEDYMITRVR